jgi:hypothetical protein
MIRKVKRRGERPPHKIVCEHSKLQQRIEDVRNFRRQHKKLSDVISKVLVEKVKPNKSALTDVNNDGDKKDAKNLAKKDDKTGSTNTASGQKALTDGSTSAAGADAGGILKLSIKPR